MRSAEGRCLTPACHLPAAATYQTVKALTRQGPHRDERISNRVLHTGKRKTVERVMASCGHYTSTRFPCERTKDNLAGFTSPRETGSAYHQPCCLSRTGGSDR